ncbi:class III lanthionine synthetase LanKC [Streptomyces stelliscabiei]|uniref:class III lanthionine synthetase LanKC n=1 Tax=Streptomyces stelliscabiei TaxID=146820 RepID=UPI0029A6F84A|nr:class III lanthionine synthetase LanKC [Streptomyces stelliscabiei]MDX2552397.1 class III lanthionine synthetase LanKC [Streptomyces stelliscabiei]MDX2611792.1 class III lanthionine synthetase LanKC [Streptomyces stelliscabiei]MDX2637141.1 class III lanthionine synthetase LanKC [Streptomyces stelliscabiei]MDX2660558.1 class III lanthionine synthetase LanKC [Streptomyces stelliscabiei]MDX2714872.1 class III lanthionine synthetase LanKC [Streptomyces stelliscabiei]
MDKRYEAYALADRHFYETPDRLSAGDRAGAAAPGYATAGRAVPEGWRAARIGDWLTLTPVDDGGRPRPGPTQGWKVHASATRGNADRIAAIVWDYCVPRGIPFKFVPGPHLLHLRNAKYAARDSSGKFVTVYPGDEEQLHLVLRELGDLLKGHDGPYILTDLRWNEGPLYVRYGAFARSFVVDERGTLVPAVRDGAGTLVPDQRKPTFHVPEWVTLPAFLEPQLAARNTTTVGDLPYRIDKALHFSNGGGVYVGTDTRDGRRVVLKEGRPHAGLAADGADAVTRLEREKDALERLAGLGVVPEVRDWFTLGDHRFLVMDFVEGRPLNSCVAERHPLLAPDPQPDAVAAYTAWALHVHRAVEEAVAAVHSRGIVFNDLHVFNIMVAPDDRSVSLLDFEAAAPAEDDGRQTVAHPGFLAPPDRTGPDVDRYALACLRLALFLPVTSLFVVEREKAAHLATVIAEQFPEVPSAFLDEAVAEITRAGGDAGPRPAGTRAPAGDWPLAGPGDWPYSRDSMVKAILASATPERDDRLFPGDVAQFSDGGGLGLAHGAAGVLYALAEVGAERYEEGERWLLDHTAPVPIGTPLGLYDGLAGVALTLDRLGHRQRALDLVERILAEKWHRLSSDLRGGLAGLGLVLDELARTTGESGLRERAAEAARLLVDRLAEPRPAPPRRRAGLLRGASGPALFLLRRYEATGDPALLASAGEALRQDLECLVEQTNGGLAVDEGWRTMPYLGDGSVGVGMVLDDYTAAAATATDGSRTDGSWTADPRAGASAAAVSGAEDTTAEGTLGVESFAEGFARIRAGVLTAATYRFYAQPGLFEGRAGMILHLARTGAPRETLTEQIAALGWHSMPYEGQLAFPGNHLMRLSMDLGTGTAGCLLALGAAHADADDATAHLPFLPPLRRRPQ